MTVKIIRERKGKSATIFTSGNLTPGSRELKQLLQMWMDKPGIVFRFNDGWGSDQFLGQSEVRKLIRRGV